MERIYKEPAIDAEGNVDGPELLLEIKRLPNGSFMLIRDRLGGPNDRIVLDARALSAIDRTRFGNLPGDGAFGGDAPAEAHASLELVPTPEGEAGRRHLRPPAGVPGRRRCRPAAGGNRRGLRREGR